MSSILIRAATADGPDNVSCVRIPDEVETEKVVSFAREFVGLHQNLPIRNGLSAVTVIRIALGLPLPGAVPECLVNRSNVPEELQEAYLGVESSADPSLCISALIAYLSKKTGHTLVRSYDCETPGDVDDAFATIVYGSLDKEVDVTTIASSFE